MGDQLKVDVLPDAEVLGQSQVKLEEWITSQGIVLGDGATPRFSAQMEEDNESAEKTCGCTNVRHASADRNACPALSEPPKHVTDVKIRMEPTQNRGVQPEQPTVRRKLSSFGGEPGNSGAQDGETS